MRARRGEMEGGAPPAAVVARHPALAILPQSALPLAFLPLVLPPQTLGDVVATTVPATAWALISRPPRSARVHKGRGIQNTSPALLAFSPSECRLLLPKDRHHMGKRPSLSHQCPSQRLFLFLVTSCGCCTCFLHLASSHRRYRLPGDSFASQTDPGPPMSRAQRRSFGRLRREALAEPCRQGLRNPSGQSPAGEGGRRLASSLLMPPLEGPLPEMLVNLSKRHQDLGSVGVSEAQVLCGLLGVRISCSLTTPKAVSLNPTGCAENNPGRGRGARSSRGGAILCCCPAECGCGSRSRPEASYGYRYGGSGGCEVRSARTCGGAGVLRITGTGTGTGYQGLDC